MASPFPAISLAFVFLLCSSLSARSSTIGVEHISPLLQLQDRERTPASVQVAAAHGVLRRLLPSHSSSFAFRIVSKLLKLAFKAEGQVKGKSPMILFLKKQNSFRHEQCGGEYCFMIRNPLSSHRQGDGEILIAGVTGVDLLAGLHWYLKNWCHSHISWDKTGGSQLFSVPKPGLLPRVRNGGVVIQRPVPWNYYQNAVTSSYSFAWWDWERWEKEIDWMALQGINLPLAFTGQEAIWQKVFMKFNLSSSDLDDFFGGPAFLAWSRMGNLHGWGGPLPQDWFDQQLVLQKKILSRMFELGMTPVLPAFSGNVPAALKSIFPSARITQLGNWFSVQSDSRWTCTYLLDAADPLFIEIGKAFIEQQLKEYGWSGHIYNCDTFDENTPPVDDPDYISSLGASIFRGMQAGDSDAVWLMQGWLFSYDPFWKPEQMKALLHSVPVGKLVVLDLFAEVKPIWISSEQFYGVPYIWCMLHNFAGNVEMYGILDALASGPVEARTSSNSTMVGVGMSMEGIEQNPVVYDLMSEMAFRHDKVDVQVWIDCYSTRRYGQSVPSIKEAWSILYHTIYNCTDGAYDKNRDVIVSFPDVDPSNISIFRGSSVYDQGKQEFRRMLLKDEISFEQPHLWYSTSKVIRALELFIASSDQLHGSNTFRYDLVDVTRQALAKYANELFFEIIEAYQSNDADKVTTLSKKFVELVGDTDILLASHDGFLLGPWLESAKKLANNEEQEIQFEWNARSQITMWFDNMENEPSLLRDYGNKYWSGLVGDYYGPRASIYFKFLIESMKNRTGFKLKEWRREWIKLTNDWQSSRKIFAVESSGNAVSTALWLYKKYFLEDQTLHLSM